MTFTYRGVKPRWTAGRYGVMRGDEMLGYFRQFRSAWAYVDALAAHDPAQRYLILDGGVIVNVRGPRGTVRVIRRDTNDDSFREIVADQLTEEQARRKQLWMTQMHGGGGKFYTVEHDER